MRMNREQHGNNNDKASAPIMDHSSTAPVVDDRKPPPVSHPVQRASGNTTKSLSSPEATMKPLVKRKRRSPEKPWKKPKDMPKRPLSAYNLFFRDERERLLSAGPAGDKKPGVSAAATPKGKGKRSKKTSGIGFANLAKTIAAKWKELDDEVKAPYEKIAAEEKKVYDEAVAEWRVKQKAKKKALAAEKKAAEESRMVAMREAPMAPNLFSSERSLGSFSDTSNPYPSEWFHANPEVDASERSASGRGSIPPVVDASLAGAGEDRRGYDATSAWGSQARHADAYYHQRYGTSEQQLHYHHRYAQQQHSQQQQQQHDYSRSGYDLQPNLFSYDTSTQAQQQAYREYYQGYREYYNQQQTADPSAAAAAAMHYPQQHRHHGDMRMSRGSSATQQQQVLAQEYNAHDANRGSEMAGYHQQHSAASQHHRHQQQHHPRARSASMPPVQGVLDREGAAALDDSFRSEPGGYARGASAGERQAAARPSYNPASGAVDAAAAAVAAAAAAAGGPLDDPVVDSEVDPVDDTFPSLTETLDEDAISFITSMKYS